MAAAALVVAEFSTVSYRTIGIGACADRVGADKCRTLGHDAHAFALVILAVVGLVMAWGAVVGRSRAAAFATAGIGLAVLLIALALDLPGLDDQRGLEKLYNDVGTHVGNGFRLELLGGVLLLLVGGLALGRLGEDEEAAIGTEPEPESSEPDAAPPSPDAEPEPEPEPEAYRPNPRTTARAKARERSRQRRPRKS